jgi:hypothetical protein
VRTRCDCDMMGFQAFTRLSVIVLPNGGLGRGKRKVSTMLRRDTVVHIRFQIR